jgi:hypothetical protein
MIVLNQKKISQNGSSSRKLIGEKSGKILKKIKKLLLPMIRTSIKV